jgi:ABC-type branched-subunit amino acid transport system ATPase component
MGAKPIRAFNAGTEQLQLAIEGVSKRFGGVTAVENVTVTVRHGEILSVIGPNGAGKTSLLNMISGFYRPTNGAIYLEGRDITRLRPSRVAALGVARTFQEHRPVRRHDSARQHHARPARAHALRRIRLADLLGTDQHSDRPGRDRYGAGAGLLCDGR